MGGVRGTYQLYMPNIIFFCHLETVENEVKKHLDRTEVEEPRLCDTNSVAPFSSVPARSRRKQLRTSLTAHSLTVRESSQACIFNFRKTGEREWRGREREKRQTIAGKRLLLPIQCENPKTTDLIYKRSAGRRAHTRPSLHTPGSREISCNQPLRTSTITVNVNFMELMGSLMTMELPRLLMTMICLG